MDSLVLPLGPLVGGLHGILQIGHTVLVANSRPGGHCRYNEAHDAHLSDQTLVRNRWSIRSRNHSRIQRWTGTVDPKVDSLGHMKNRGDILVAAGSRADEEGNWLWEGSSLQGSQVEPSEKSTRAEGHNREHLEHLWGLLGLLGLWGLWDLWDFVSREYHALLEGRRHLDDLVDRASPAGHFHRPDPPPPHSLVVQLSNSHKTGLGRA